VITSVPAQQPSVPCGEGRTSLAARRAAASPGTHATRYGPATGTAPRPARPATGTPYDSSRRTTRPAYDRGVSTCRVGGTVVGMTDLRPGVLFDVDGTLLDTNYLHTLAWWRALEDTGHTGISMAAIHRSIGIASEGLVERLVGHTDQKAVEAHSARYEELREHVTAFPRTADLVAHCATQGLVPVLATSGKEKDLGWMLPAIGAEDSLAGVTTSSDVKAGKPAPDLIGTAVRNHHLDPERSAVVGDTVWDVKAAARAGVRCIAVTTGGVSEAELLEAGAVEVYDGVGDLLEHFDESLLGRLLA
jgi:phosphoglycolate phosphatase-like HAD superfamily hydrolase